MLDANNNIVHTDLNAVITGPNKGRFPAGTYRPNPVEPDRDQPFREFTVVYHDEIKAIQAFPQFEDPVLSHTLYSVKDGFAINYGTGGIGAEILANRLGVGPMANCTECKYEDFFLSAWAVGDPAQIVDVPANTTDGSGNLIKGAKATKVLFPDDPSNVHHSYLNDHVKMRVVHAGPKEHHIHHLHAHQWLNTPDSDNSSYLDSQAMGPGYSFTTEIAHGGSGNRNKTPGDSIFHCHFYPHFAQGMWEMWRTHDVFEEGTQLDGDGRPVNGARALPDGEIAKGTPIPAHRAASDYRDGSDADRGVQRLSVLHSGRRRTPSAAPAARHDRRWWSTASRHRWRRGRKRRELVSTSTKRFSLPMRRRFPKRERRKKSRR